jgi:hypothetical protein
MFSDEQRMAVHGVFRLAGYDGPLLVAPFTSEDERVFVLPPGQVERLSDVRTVQQVVGQLLARKVVVVAHSQSWQQLVAFE